MTMFDMKALTVEDLIMANIDLCEALGWERSTGLTRLVASTPRPPDQLLAVRGI
jgi:hypothetical protein